MCQLNHMCVCGASLNGKDEVLAMVNIYFRNSAGQDHIVPAVPGESLMEAAVTNGVPGIDASCGGACSCATCMVYVEDDWSSRLSPKSDMEQGMLIMSPYLRETSRLACQITVDAHQDGMVVIVPDQQL